MINKFTKFFSKTKTIEKTNFQEKMTFSLRYVIISKIIHRNILLSINDYFVQMKKN